MPQLINFYNSSQIVNTPSSGGIMYVSQDDTTKALTPVIRTAESQQYLGTRYLMLARPQDGAHVVIKYNDSIVIDTKTNAADRAKVKGFQLVAGTSKPEGYTFTATIKNASNNPYTFTMDDASKTGSARSWTADKDGYTITYQDPPGNWVMKKNGVRQFYIQYMGKMPWQSTSSDITFTSVSSATTNTPMSILTIGQDNNWLVISRENNRIYLKGKSGSSGYDDQFTDYFSVSDYDMSGWHMYTLTYQVARPGKSTYVALTIDKDAKVLDIQSPFLSYISLSRQAIFLGSNKLDGNVFRGSISSLRVYNKIISADQVAQLYNETSQEQA